VAKPPLFFWSTALGVSVLGDHEAGFRSTSFLALSFILLLAYKKYREKPYIAFIVMILCMGSPMLMDLSRRVMLDLPLTAAGLWALYYAQKIFEGGKVWPFFFLCALGWGLKEIAFLPFMAGPLLGLLCFKKGRQALWNPWALMSLALCVAILGVLFWQQPTLHISQSLARAADASATGLNAPWTSYWHALREESPLVLATPLALIWAIFQKNAGLTLMLFTWVFSALAVSAVDLKLPHYLAPLIALSLYAWGDFLKDSRKPLIVATLAALAVIQGFKTQWLLWEPDSFYMHWGRSTYELSQTLRKHLSRGAHTCAVNAYPVGFSFYTGYPMLGFYTSDKAYATVNAVSEFQGMIFRISTEELPEVASRCAWHLVGPSAYFEKYPELFRILHSVNLLSVARILRPDETQDPAP